MGKPDVFESDYLDDNGRLADMINGALYHGMQLVLPQDLEEADPELIYLGGDDGIRKAIRDKVRRWKKNGILFAILAVENQNYVDYVMVLRSMLTEAMAYHKQWKEKKNQHKNARDLKEKDEFLSGIQSGERFVPVITLIVYYGTQKSWDGPRTLYELLDMQDKEELKPFINDYKLNLFDFHEKDSFGEFQTELRTLFEFLRYSEDEQSLHNAIQSNAERYHSLDKETARLISELTGIDAEEYSETISGKEENEPDKEDNGRSEFDMCKAWDDHKLRGVTEKTKIVVINMLKRGMSDEDICGLAECTPEFLEEVKSEVFETA